MKHRQQKQVANLNGQPQPMHARMIHIGETSTPYIHACHKIEPHFRFSEGQAPGTPTASIQLDCSWAKWSCSDVAMLCTLEHLLTEERCAASKEDQIHSFVTGDRSYCKRTESSHHHPSQAYYRFLCRSGHPQWKQVFSRLFATSNDHWVGGKTPLHQLTAQLV